MKRNEAGARKRHRQGWIVYSGNGDWEYEHRLILERHLGRKLKANERTKHRNGDLWDNRLSNLELEIHPKPNPWIPCGCGCGLRRRRYHNGHERRFIHGHEVRVRKRAKR